jgi:hypothetical protein
MICESCNEDSFLVPLHGGKGGPLRCPLCVGKWNAEHGRRRRTGRVAIRAIKAFFDAGGELGDIDKLKWSAVADGNWDEFGDQLGYMDGIAQFNDADVDLTSELLADILKLIHPDHQPPERKAVAHRVTQQLLALQPFVFPAPRPKPIKPPPHDEPPPQWLSDPEDQSKPAKPRYPCSDCADAYTWEYCDACRAELWRREQEEFDKRTTKQRADYAKRRQRTLAHRPPRTCATCAKTLKSTRADARYCSDRCRQQAHRQPVTDKYKTHGKTSINRDKIERDILALLARHSAVYLNDLLPAHRTNAQYQAVALITRKLEAEGKIESVSYMSCFNHPGFLVLTKPGHEIKDRDVIELGDDERLRLEAA